MAELLQRSIPPTIAIRTSFPLGLPSIRSDANQLANALLNLVVNARDAIAEGGLITVSGKRQFVAAGQMAELSPSEYVRISVQDEGSGMDAETLNKATTPFLRPRESARVSVFPWSRDLWRSREAR